MYKTIRMLPAALLLLLLGTACTNDLANAPATGFPLVLEHVYIGTSTKAEPYEPGFADGSTLEATIALNGVTTTEGTYRYNGTTWEQTSTTPAYWQNTKEEHTVTLRTPKPEYDMPAAFTQENWHEYDLLEYSQATTATNSFTLAHTRAQLCVALEKGNGLTSAELAAAKVSVNGTGMLRHLNSAHYAILAPAEKARPEIVIDINGSKYPYTPDKDIPLTAGTCTILTLALNKVGVEGFQVSSGEGWQDMTATSTEDDTWIVRHSTGDDLDLSDIGNDAKLLITGTLTSDDMTTISHAKNQITHLYIMAKAKDNDESIWNKEEFMQESTSLQSVCITEATAIGKYAFYGCGQLTNVSLPKVKSTGNYAFQYCKALANVSLPMVESIGAYAFEECTALTDISLPETTSIDSSAFFQCTSLASVHLPQVKEMKGTRIFYGCTALTSISLPELESIERAAFYGCSNLASVSLPKVTNVGHQAFGSCSSLTTICLPKATSISDGIFDYCSSLTTICLPKATSISDGIFDYCSSLTTICLPKDTNMRPTDLDYLRSVTTLFLCNDSNDALATEEDIAKWTDAAPTLTTVFYDYKDTADGDYLDPNNYDQVWTRY